MSDQQSPSGQTWVCRAPVNRPTEYDVTTKIHAWWNPPVIVVRWADGTSPAPPAPLTRPDTDELRATAHFVCDDIDNGRGDDASDLILAAAYWIDAQPAPLAPTLPSAPVERPAAITDEMLRAAETHHGDSCSYCTSAGDIDCPTAAILDALTTSPAPGDNP